MRDDTIWMSVAGDATDSAIWSGTTAHLIEHARIVGLPFNGLVLHRPGEAARRAWNLLSLARHGKPGGFQYSPWFLDRLWRHQTLAGRTIMSCYQLLPDTLIAASDVARWFYIDGTLTQLWGSRDYTARPLPPAVVAAALARERRGYHAARGVICHSRWAADSIVADYGVPADRVAVVVPGANLEPAGLDRWHARLAPPVPTGPLRLVFVGKDPVRKGLDRLLEALPVARGRGAPIELRVIGCARESVGPALAATSGVAWLGMIDKRAQADRFLEAVGWAEVGCLFSRAEFGGMVQREYAALGLIGIGPAVGGAPEHAGPGALLVPPGADSVRIADLLVDLSARGDVYHRLRAAAQGGRAEATWRVAARRLHDIVNAGDTSPHSTR